MRFLTGFIFSALLGFGPLYGLILAVDPYNKLGNNLFGFETKAVDFARVNKFNQVEHGKKAYTAFILGSSSAHRYLTSELNRLTGLESYNYSTQSATPEDYLSMTRHILSKYKPKLIILSMDFEVLNANVETDDMFYSSPLKNYLNEMPEDEKEADFFNNSYMTLEAVADTFKVIFVNLFGKAHHAYLEDGNHVVEPKPKTVVVSQFDGREFTFDQKRIQYLKTIKQLATQKGIKIITLTSPLSPGHLAMVQKQFPNEHAEFKRVLVDIFGEVWDFQNDSIAPYDSVEFFQNANHANHSFSTHILERIFGQKNSPGIFLKK
jgi:hypothetical protein